MTDTDPVAMDEAERDEFLGKGGVGVISLSTADDAAPHAIPVSYGYDAAEATFYFRLAVEPESRKGDLDGRAVTFVTYGSTDEGYRSVVASGRLERTTDESIAAETLDGLDRVRIPLFDVFGKRPADVQFEFHRLVPDRLTGRKESAAGV